MITGIGTDIVEVKMYSKTYYQKLTIQSIHLSLSHTKHYAQAFVILDK